MEELKQTLYVNGKGIYFPEKEETLQDIADKFSTTAKLIAIDNNLFESALSGRAIYVKSRGKTYTVTPTDTIENIAEKSGFSPETILKMNGITYVYPGQKIILR